MPREVLDGLGSALDANMENLSGQDTRIPYGPRRSELEATAAGLEIEGRGQMGPNELVVAIEAAKQKAKPKKGKSK